MEELNTWQLVLPKDIDLKVLTKVLPQKGNLVYEYNPFRNYRLSKSMYEFKDSLYSLYELYTIYGIALNIDTYEDDGDSQNPSQISKSLYMYENNGSHYYIACTPSERDEDYILVATDENSEDVIWRLNKYPSEVCSLIDELEYCYNGTKYASQESFESALLECTFNSWADNGKLDNETDPILREKGELVDFITDELSFSLSNPVTIVPQYSYDGSVNLILNDGLNIPRLINTRFSATGRNTYEVVDRKGDNDTNIYDQGDQFDIDTSLFKRVTKIPKLEFGGVNAGGNLPVGQYHFYFKYADADGNETDFVAESGLVSVFIGYGSPFSTHTGSADENSTKSVKFFMTNIDASYNFVHVYYSRHSAQPGQSDVVTYYRIDKNFAVNNAQQCTILITGYETILDSTEAEINMFYQQPSAVTTATECQNMLMLGNIHKPEIPYDELADLSLRFLPYIKQVTYTLDMSQNYGISSTNMGYYDPNFIYSSVGYWPGEYYRLGIVYIMPNNELTPVFNIRGRCEITPFTGGVSLKPAIVEDGLEGKDIYFENSNVNKGQFNHYHLYKTENDTKVRNYIRKNEETFYVIDPDEGEAEDGKEGYIAYDKNYWENTKGVCSFKPFDDTDQIYALDIRVDDDVLQELKRYVKGYFFVRQHRIPTILCQGITIGIDNQSRTPTLPTVGGFLDEIASSIDGSTYVEVDDITDVNYISEGFLNRYRFSIEEKKQGFWKTLGKIIGELTVSFMINPLSGITNTGTIISSACKGEGFMTGVTKGVASAMEPITTLVTVIAAGGKDAIEEDIQASARTQDVNELNGRYTTIEKNYKRVEADTSRQLSHNFRERAIIMSPSKNTVGAILCPDYEVDQDYYNQIFTGNEHVLITTNSQNINEIAMRVDQGAFASSFFDNSDNHFYVPKYYDRGTTTTYSCAVQAVPDDTKAVGIGSTIFRSRAGMAEEAWHYECVGQEWEEDEDKKINAEIIRGSFGPYLAVTDYPNNPCETVNIMIPGYSSSSTSEYVELRMDDDSKYYAISERYAMEDSDDNLITPLANIVGFEDRSCGYSWELYRGDCYICQFTHRLNRNFNDPSAPYNDAIVDPDSWKDNYDPVDNPDKLEDINLGDVNAIKLGMWVTFKVRSNYNLNIRTVDNSWTDEKIMCGHGRGYFPYLPMNTEGVYKTPESDVYNAGFHESLSMRHNSQLPDVPYIKNWFGTRIMYSDIHVNDAYKNGFRVFKGTSYIDCPRTYGEITKILELSGNLLIVFEHGIGIAQVNGNAAAANAQAGHDHMTVTNAISQPKMLSTKFGSQWPESIIVTEGANDSGSMVYGVDTVAKKIWACNGGSINCISDFKVEEFLINNITLGERELTPIIGIRNVKTAYNAFKKDVLFTFYDNLSGFEEKVWNLCWNEIMGQFVTFYSWVPSYMENINNMPFSFNRNTSKWIAKLGVSHADNSFADGITLTNNIMENSWNGSDPGTETTSFKADLLQECGVLNEVTLKPDADANHIDEQTGNETFGLTGNANNQWFYYDANYRNGLVGILGVANINLPTGTDIIYKVDYSLERDNFRNDKLFEIKNIGYYIHNYDCTSTLGSEGAGINRVKVPVYGLYLKEGVSVYDLSTEMYYRNIKMNSYSDWDTNKSQIGSDEIPTMEQLISNNYPIFKNRKGQRLTLDRDDMINPTHIVRLLNIKATVYGYYGGMEETVQEYFYNYARENASDSEEEGVAYQNLDSVTIEGYSKSNTDGQWVDCGYYESVVAVIPRWNMQFLSTDFWKHGQAGIIDIADKIYPAYWYGEQHPFEIEFVVVNDAATHKIFTNLEIISNNVKPESFHYEIVGDVYDFAKDKVNMYFRQEAMKALYQYNGADILYNDNFLETQPKQNKVSADLPHQYYARQDTFNEIYDSYKQAHAVNKDYDHISGSEIVYYPTRDEYRIWVHQKAVSMDDFGGDSTMKLKEGDDYLYEEDAWENARALIASNCRYVEDKWKVTINPIVVCYKNEYHLDKNPSNLTSSNSSWTSPNRPPLPVFNSPLPLDENGDDILTGSTISDEDFPSALTDIGYGVEDLDATRWLDDIDIHGYRWGGEGTACNREELDIRDKFVKVRIRYTGDQLVLIDFINTIYQLSKA